MYLNPINFPKCRLMTPNLPDCNRFVIVDYDNRIYLVTSSGQQQQSSQIVYKKILLAQHDKQITSIVATRIERPETINGVAWRIVYYFVVFVDIDSNVFCKAWCVSNHRENGWEKLCWHMLDTMLIRLFIRASTSSFSLALSAAEIPQLMVMGDDGIVCNYNFNFWIRSGSGGRDLDFGLHFASPAPLTLIQRFKFSNQVHLLRFVDANKSLIYFDTIERKVYCWNYTQNTNSCITPDALPDSNLIYDTMLTADGKVVLLSNVGSQKLELITINPPNLQPLIERTTLLNLSEKDVRIVNVSLDGVAQANRYICKVLDSNGDISITDPVSMSFLYLNDSKNFQHLPFPKQFFDGHIIEYAYSANGNFLAVGCVMEEILVGPDGLIRKHKLLVYNLSTKSFLHCIDVEYAYTILQIDFVGPNQNIAILSLYDHRKKTRLSVYDANSGECIKTIEPDYTIAEIKLSSQQDQFMVLSSQQENIFFQLWNATNFKPSSKLYQTKIDKVSRIGFETVRDTLKAAFNTSGKLFACAGYILRGNETILYCVLLNLETGENKEFIKVVDGSWNLNLMFISNSSILIIHEAEKDDEDEDDGDALNIGQEVTKISLFTVCMHGDNNFYERAMVGLRQWLKKHQLYMDKIAFSPVSNYIVMACKPQNNPRARLSLYLMNLNIANSEPFLLLGEQLVYETYEIIFSQDGAQLIFVSNNMMTVIDILQNREVAPLRLTGVSDYEFMTKYMHRQTLSLNGLVLPMSSFSGSHQCINLFYGGSKPLQNLLLLILKGLRNKIKRIKTPHLPPELWLMVYEQLLNR